LSESFSWVDWVNYQLNESRKKRLEKKENEVWVSEIVECRLKQVYADSLVDMGVY